MSNMEEETIGNLAGSQNQYITDTGHGACVKTAYPGQNKKFKSDQFNGPYSGDYEYKESYKYISPNFNPGTRVWNNVKPEKYDPEFQPRGVSFIPRNDTNGKLYSVDVPYNSYFTQPVHGLHNMYEPFGLSSISTKFVIQLLVIAALIYVVYYLMTNKQK